MKSLIKTVSKSLAITAGLSAALCSGVAVAGELTVEQNMAEQHKANVVPGKTLKAKGPNYQFCEVAPIIGTSIENAVANFFNPTGLDHCTPEDFEKIVAIKEQIIKDTGAMDVFLNPSRHWTWDEFEVFEIGKEVTFGSVKFVWMGVVPYEPMTKAVGHGSYNPAPNDLAWVTMDEFQNTYQVCGRDNACNYTP